MFNLGDLLVFLWSPEDLCVCVCGEGGGGQGFDFSPIWSSPSLRCTPTPGCGHFCGLGSYAGGEVICGLSLLLTPVGDPCGSFFVPWYHRFSISPKTNSFKFHNRFLKTPWCKMNNSRMFFLIVAGKEPKRTVAWSSPSHLSATLQMADVWKIHLLL